jgi:hypothetical protein
MTGKGKVSHTTKCLISVFCVLAIAVAVLETLALSAVHAAADNNDFRQWIEAAHQARYEGHGCDRQAATLRQVRDEGGGVIPLGDNRFFIAWFPPSWENHPDRRLVVTLHGNGGCAERMFTFWHRTASLHDYGFIALQYAEESSRGRYRFDDSRAIYRLLRRALGILRRHVPLEGVPLILHGFSRGSARVFELAAMDRAPGGMHAFSAFIADSGTVFPEYRGRLSPYLERIGPDAYAGARFWLYCGGRDHGGRTCRGLARMARFVRAHSGTVDTLYRYPPGGHGIFLTGGLHRQSPPLEALFSYINSLGE